MNTLEAIATRRSIRKYKQDAVSEEQITTLLKAAMLAPSAGNAQPWEFIIVQRQETKDLIAQYNPYAGMASHAPLSIVVCGNLQKERFPGYWVQDCSAAIQNILLAAHEIGLGTVWTGVYPIQDRVENYSKVFSLPEHIIPLGIIVVGYPDQKTGEADRYDSSKVHYETF